MTFVMRLLVLANNVEPAMAMNRSRTGEWRRMAGGLLLLFAGLALGGCQVAHMALPQGLESESSALAVKGLGSSFITKTIKFGPYQVTDIRRGWTKGSGFSISSGSTEFSSSKAKQKYEFSVSGPDRGKWNAQCATGANWSQLETQGFLGGKFGIEFSANQQLICNLKPEGGGKESKLFMSRSARAGEDALRGVMIDGATRIDVSATLMIAQSPLKLNDPTGYIFHVGGRPVGAVEVFNKGTVWLDNSVTPEVRSALAATAVVMLLYQDIQK